MKNKCIWLLLVVLFFGTVSTQVFATPEGDAVYDELTQKVIEISKAWEAVPPGAGEAVWQGVFEGVGYRYSDTFLVAAFKSNGSNFDSMYLHAQPKALFERDIPKFISEGCQQDNIGGFTVVYDFTNAVDYKRGASWNVNDTFISLKLNSPLATNPKPRHIAGVEPEPKPEPEQPVAEEIKAEIKIIPNLIALYAGGQGKALNVKITPSEAPVGPVIITDYDGEVLEVDDQATVYGKKPIKEKTRIFAEAKAAGLKTDAWVYVIPENAYGILIHTNDNTYIRRAAATDKVKVQENEWIFQGDRVVTYHPAGTMMITPKYGRMRIFPTKEEDVELFGDTAAVYYENMVNQAKVTMTKIMKNLTEDDSFKLKIPTATCGVRG